MKVLGLEMIYGAFLDEFKKLFRQLERIDRKISRHNASILFTETGLNEDTLPTYGHIMYICIVRPFSKGSWKNML